MSAADVQAVIDELEANGGGTVVWKDGEFRYSQNGSTTVGGEAAAIELKSGIEYVGQGYSTHIIQDEKDINVFATDYDDQDSDNETAGEVENIRVANMRLDGNKAAFSDFSSRQVNNVLWTPLARNITIENLWVHDVHQHGIHPDAILDSTIRNNRIWNSDGQGMHVATRTTGGTTHGPTDNCIEGNVLWGNGNQAIGVSGAENGESNKVLGNTILSGSGAGITCSARSCIVSNNTIRDVSVHGILFSTSSHDGHCVAEGNTIVGVTGSPGAGISIAAPHCQTDDNTIRNCEKGVYVNQAENASVGSDNCESVTEHGILAEGDSGGAGGNDLTIRGASVHGAGSLLDIGANCQAPRIEGFTGSGATNSLGAPLNAPGGVLRDSTFRDNTGNDGVTVNGDGWLIDGCKAFDNARHGIRVDGADCNVVNPEVSGNGGDGVRDNGTRLQYNGVIAGGPLGGTDIGSLTGASEGDQARADGTTGDADALYILTASGDWQALHDPTTTITPA